MVREALCSLAGARHLVSCVEGPLLYLASQLSGPWGREGPRRVSASEARLRGPGSVLRWATLMLWSLTLELRAAAQAAALGWAGFKPISFFHFLLKSSSYYWQLKEQKEQIGSLSLTKGVVISPTPFKLEVNEWFWGGKGRSYLIAVLIQSWKIYGRVIRINILYSALILVEIQDFKS